jgi:spore germination cell wall hydrolase CwlJ-like protein
MAPRWIGLLRAPKSASCKHRSVRESARALSAAGFLLAAAGLNFAMHPEALAQAVGADIIQSFVPDEPTTLNAAPQAIPVNEAEVRLLAATVWGEARSEGEEGMRAVAHVMMNRIGSRFGENLETVIMTPYQFSVWNRGDPNRRLVSNPDRYATGGTALATWEQAQQIAREVLSGQSIDPTGGALFYHTRAVRPSWASHGVGRQVIGAHIFYADVPDRGIRRTPPTRMAVTQVAQTFRQPIPIDGAAGQVPGALQTAMQGPRAGRVNGVIQTAPAAMARQQLPSERSGGEPIDVNAAATPTINGVPITAINSR